MAKYVKLRHGVTAFADLDTGFAITGADVVEVPHYAEDIVKDKIQKGVLVEATEGEYHDIHDDEVEVIVQPIEIRQEISHQEARVQEQARAKREAVAKGRKAQPKEADELAEVAVHPEAHQDEKQRRGRPAKAPVKE